MIAFSTEVSDMPEVTDSWLGVYSSISTSTTSSSNEYCDYSESTNTFDSNRLNLWPLTEELYLGSLKEWAADYFFPPTPPKKLLSKAKPFFRKYKTIKQPVSRSGFKRGQRNLCYKE